MPSKELLEKANKNNYLTMDELKELYPAAFISEPTRNLSKEYVHIPTNRVVEDMMTLGWHPTGGGQRKQRASKVGTVQTYNKHMVKLQNHDIKIKNGDKVDSFPQILLINSHDGLNSFKFRVGIYRIACSNGMIIAIQELTNLRIRHAGYNIDELRNTLKTITESIPKKVDIINNMKETILTKEQQEEFAINAAYIRKGINPKLEDKPEIGINPYDLLYVEREADAGDDLWLTFNRVQEKLMKGNYVMDGRGGRAIKSFETDLRINTELYNLAAEYMN